MSESIAIAAEKLANDKLIMDSYKDFFDGKGYFLTLNPSLFGAAKKPISFPSKKSFATEWNKFSHAQKIYLAKLSGLNPDRISLQNYNAIENAYLKWASGYYVVFYGGGKNWACNLFVGEALYLAQQTQINSGKYYSAKQIWNAEGGFKLINNENIKRGDIAAFNGTHVEIVTKVNRNQKFFDDDFCSRGAGRLLGRDMGTEICEGLIGNKREIKNQNIKILRLS